MPRIPKDPQTAWELQKGNVILTKTCPALWHTFIDTKHWETQAGGFLSEFEISLLYLVNSGRTSCSTVRSPKQQTTEGEGENRDAMPSR